MRYLTEAFVIWSSVLAIKEHGLSNNKDEAQTQNIFDDDVILDNQYKELSKAILKELKRDEDHLEDLAHLLFVTRHLERIGNHAKKCR